jgi:hypothetical protein
MLGKCRVACVTDKVYAIMAKIRTHDNVNKGALIVAGIYS